MSSKRSSPVRFAWKEAYSAAVLEANDSRLSDRIDVAEQVLLSRFLDLTNREEDQIEVAEVEVALKAIQNLKRERLDHGSSKLTL